ncbi:MAG TPA: hypothetical protein VFA43_24670 [Gemmatimonadaceae bacterium]|nr:hypothetical protein [Gemmatimonadaceae bacterium]
MCARVRGLVAIVLTAAACGHDSTSPPALSHAPITFLRGNGQSDTIQTVLDQALVVRVGTGPDGQSAANQVVRFQSVQDSGTYRAQIEPLAGGTPMPFFAETTDASGEASIVVALGIDAGVGKIIVTVPQLGYADTALYTVLPGHAVSLLAAPNDTDASLGNTVTLRTRVVDRYGNARSDSVSLSVSSGIGSLHGHTLTVSSYGPIQVVGSADGFTDTTTVYGVPTGLLAASGDAGGIYTFNVDGSHYTQISSIYAGTLKWAPNGQSFVFDQTVAGLYGATGLMQTIQLGGQVATLVNSGATAIAYPQYSRDGQWIYYDMYSTSQPIWRVHPDGTSDTTIYMISPEGLQFPSPSPDGTQLSYILGGEQGNLKILTLSTGAAVDLGVKGVSDVWSPTGNVIAYLTTANAIALIRSDGTNGSMLAPGPYGTQFDWSPDGNWIIARNTATTRLELINVTSRLVVPLGYTGTVGSPTWH